MKEVGLTQKVGNGTKGIIIIKELGIVDFRVIIGVLIFIMVHGIHPMEILIKEIKVIILQIGNITKESTITITDGIVDYQVTIEGPIFIMALGTQLTEILTMVLFLLDGNGNKENNYTI